QLCWSVCGFSWACAMDPPTAIATKATAPRIAFLNIIFVFRPRSAIGLAQHAFRNAGRQRRWPFDASQKRQDDQEIGKVIEGEDFCPDRVGDAPGRAVGRLRAEIRQQDEVHHKQPEEWLEQRPERARPYL